MIFILEHLLFLSFHKMGSYIPLHSRDNMASLILLYVATVGMLSYGVAGMFASYSVP